MKLSEIVNQVIRLAEAVRTYWETELPKRHRDYPIVRPGEDSGPPPPEEKTLRDLLASLPEDVIYKLALILEVARGMVDIRNLAAGYQEVQESYDSAAEAAAYMADFVGLDDDLSDGLAELNKHKINIDKMNFKPAKSRK